MNIKRIIFIFAILFITGVSYTYAADFEYTRATGKVVVSGEGLERGETARMIVLKPDADYDKLVSGEVSFFTSCIHIAELTQESANGEYAFPAFMMKEGTPDGEYKIYLTAGGNTESLVLDYASISQVLGYITNSADAAEVRVHIGKFNDEIYKLPIEEGSEYSKLDSDGKEYVLSGLIGTGYENSVKLLERFNLKTNEYLELYKQRAFDEISGLPTGALVKEKIDKYEKVYGINRDDALFKGLDTTGQTAVYEKMTNETYSNETEIQLAFRQKVILRYIQMGPFGKIPEYISGFNDILGLDLSKYSASNIELLKYIVGKECKTPADLQTLIDGYIPVVQSSGGGGSSSSSGIKPIGGAVTSMPSQDDAWTEEEWGSFSDVPASHWAYESINALFEKKIVNGKSADTFAPEDSVTRAEAVKIIVEALLKDTVITGDDVEFADVSADYWAYSSISTAAKLGVVFGYSDDSFGVNDNITRQDLCVMIYRALQKANYDLPNGSSDFIDKNEISEYAANAVDSLSEMGVITGMSDGSFSPFGYATRAQLARIIYEIIK